MRRPDRVVQTFGAGIPEGEDDWGLVQHKGTPWLARGGALLVAASELSLVGYHNRLNALAALPLASAGAKINRKVLGAHCAFPGMPPRQGAGPEAGRVL